MSPTPVSTGLTTEMLAHGRVPGAFTIRLDGLEIESKDAVELSVVRLTFAPGATTGWQFPVGPVLVVVTRGSLTRYAADDCDAQTYTSGTAFVDNGANDGSIVRNERSLDAEAIVTSVTPPSAT